MKDDSGSWVVCFAIFYFVYIGCSAAWHSKARYAMQYGVAYDKVYKSNKPHDCDFLAAPIGEKNCHYDADAQKDDSNPPAKPESSVTVTWQKVEE